MLVLVSTVWAQVIDPTVLNDPNSPDVIVRNSTANSASIEQEVVLKLPVMTALHLDATTLTFDLTDANWADKLTCAYVAGEDVPYGTFNGQPQTIPGGVAYEPLNWAKIKLVYLGGAESGDVTVDDLATTYAPGVIGEDGNLVVGSKDHFVCYQTFVLQLFSNTGDWDLTVDRDDTTDQGIEHLYIQGNTCSDFGAGTGLFELKDGGSLNLLPDSLTGGPTGKFVKNGATGAFESQCRQSSSWLDVLGVIAVKVNSDWYGDSVANLTYTLTSELPQ